MSDHQALVRRLWYRSNCVDSPGTWVRDLLLQALAGWLFDTIGDDDARARMRVEWETSVAENLRISPSTCSGTGALGSRELCVQVELAFNVQRLADALLRAYFARAAQHKHSWSSGLTTPIRAHVATQVVHRTTAGVAGMLRLKAEFRGDPLTGNITSVAVLSVESALLDFFAYVRDLRAASAQSRLSVAMTWLNWRARASPPTKEELAQAVQAELTKLAQRWAERTRAIGNMVDVLRDALTKCESAPGTSSPPRATGGAQPSVQVLAELVQVAVTKLAQHCTDPLEDTVAPLTQKSQTRPGKTPGRTRV